MQEGDVIRCFINAEGDGGENEPQNENIVNKQRNENTNTRVYPHLYCPWTIFINLYNTELPRRWGQC